MPIFSVSSYFSFDVAKRYAKNIGDKIIYTLQRTKALIY